MNHDHGGPSNQHEAPHEHETLHQHGGQQLHDTAHGHDDAWSTVTDDFISHLERQERFFAPITAKIFERIDIFLEREPQQIVEIGSGAGFNSVSLAKRYPGSHLHLIDVSPDLLASARSAAESNEVATRFSFHLQDLNEGWPDIAESSADIVWAALALHHVDNLKETLSAVASTLREGGVFVLIEQRAGAKLKPHDLGTGIENFGERFGDAFSLPQHFTSTAWPDLLSGAGFKRVENLVYDFEISSDSVDGSAHVIRKLEELRAHRLDDFTASELGGLSRAAQTLQSGFAQASITTVRDVWLAKF